MLPDIPRFTTKYIFFTNSQGQQPLYRILRTNVSRDTDVTVTCAGMLGTFAHISLRCINIPPHPEETTITVRKTGSKRAVHVYEEGENNAEPWKIKRYGPRKEKRHIKITASYGGCI